MKIKTIRWSALSAWEWNKEQWYETYILGKFQSSPEMTFGSMVDEKIQSDPTFLPKLPRYPEMQHGMKVKLGNLTLTGTADGIDFEKKLLFDYKTGRHPWNTKRAKEHGQLDMYLLMLLLADKKLIPEEWKLGIHWIPTTKRESGDFKSEITFRDEPPTFETFYTKRSMQDLLKFVVYIRKTVKEMEEFVIHRKNLL